MATHYSFWVQSKTVRLLFCLLKTSLPNELIPPQSKSHARLFCIFKRPCKADSDQGQSIQFSIKKLIIHPDATVLFVSGGVCVIKAANKDLVWPTSGEVFQKLRILTNKGFHCPFKSILSKHLNTNMLFLD